MDDVKERITKDQLFVISIDNDKYYTTENTGIFVEVIEMPTISNALQLLAYRYNEKTRTLEVDENKLEQINYQIKVLTNKLTQEERLTDLENAFFELSTMIFGGA